MHINITKGHNIFCRCVKRDRCKRRDTFMRAIYNCCCSEEETIEFARLLLENNKDGSQSYIDDKQFAEFCRRGRLGNQD